MKNCTINVTTADTNDDEMPPLGTGGNVGLFKMRFGEEREGMRSWMRHRHAGSQGRHRQEMGPSWFSQGDAPHQHQILDWLSQGVQEISKPQLFPPAQPKDSSWEK